MVSMKTTVEVSDQLLRRAKALAATQGKSLKQLFTEALEQRLRVLERPGAATPGWRRLSGSLSGLRAETARIGRRMEEEFEHIDEEER
jgi:hypothetical protein